MSLRTPALLLLPLSAVLTAGVTTVSATPVAAPAPAPAPAPSPVIRVVTGDAAEPRPVRLVTPVVHVATAAVVKRAAPRRTVKAAPHHTVRRTAKRVVRRHPRRLTPELEMRAAVLLLPGYRPGMGTFVLEDRGSWGLTDLNAGIVYIAPRVPSRYMYSVVAHEWGHVLSVRAYDGDVSAALAAMNQWFGGSGLTGAERAADCMARVLGATWTNYTPCHDSRWRTGAKHLLAGQQLG